MVSLVPVYFLCQSQVLINGVSCIRKGVYPKVLEGSKTQIIKKEISILEQLGPGSSTTASGVVDQQGENCTVGQRWRKRKRVGRHVGAQ